jgi:outer membrane receptor protein involved in Fe transport
VDSGMIGFFGSIDPTEGGETSRTNANLQTFTTTDNGGLWKHQVFWSQYRFELFSNFTFFLDDPVFGDQIRQFESRNLFGYNGSFSTHHRLLGRQADLVAGVQYRHDFSEDNELAKTTNRTITREQIQYGDINEANASAYVMEHLRLGQNWHLDAGLRLEYFRNAYTDKLENNRFATANTTTLLPKLNLYYNPSPTLQAYLKLGKGFHSNDTRVVVPQMGKEVLPAAYGSDLGLLWKPTPKLLIHPALWYLWLDQEFVYVGDAGIVEAGGKTRRIGADLSARYQLADRWFADVDINITQPRAVEEAEGEQYIPLAPTLTSVGGIGYVSPKGFAANIRYRYMADRPANEDNSVVAKGYLVADAQATYTAGAFTIGLHINNVFDARWKETQFNAESRLFDELLPVEEIHFTPGSPFFARMSVAFHF